MKILHRSGIAALCLLLLASGGIVAQQRAIGFGGGGPSFGMLFMDLADIRTFTTDAGFPDLDGTVWLAGGGGRGVEIGGLSLGGAGWGAWSEGASGELRSSYAFGWGGFDIGYGIAGTASGILTVGALIGGGGGELEWIGDPSSGSVPVPLGIVPEPTRTAYGTIFFGIAPYLDMGILLTDWIGLDVRVGYLITPVSLTWLDAGSGNGDAPSLAPSGAYVRISLLFGGMVVSGGD